MRLSSPTGSNHAGSNECMIGRAWLLGVLLVWRRLVVLSNFLSSLLFTLQFPAFLQNVAGGTAAVLLAVLYKTEHWGFFIEIAASFQIPISLSNMFLTSLSAMLSNMRSSSLIGEP
ncbi:hypothetical protein BGX38DRAFT_1202197 [Terfezia claveryi]|nr:hypothetical protein BGX38DRAFT_1202197 [Terfezia claveryi]